MRLLKLVAIAALAIAPATASFAATITKSVDAHAAPWDYDNVSLNTAYTFGVHDHAAPLVITAADGISLAPGGTLTFAYVDGTVAAGPGFPGVDADGQTSFTFDDNLGNSGQPAPSKYMSGYWPTYLMALVGTFADANGQIVGNPFKVGLSRIVAVPAGAARLQLGFNDDIYADNSGSIRVQITGPTAVPTPAAAGAGALLTTLLAASRLRRPRRQA